MNLSLREHLWFAALAAVAAAGCASFDESPPGPDPAIAPSRAVAAASDAELPALDAVMRSARPSDALPALGGVLWRAVGPAGIRDGQTENIAPDNRVAGAVHAVVPHPTDRNRLWIGTTNGGVWETRNALAANPVWRPLTDHLPSSSIGALELDPTDRRSRTLIAGFGNVSSFGASGLLDGVIHSRDGGQTWRRLTDPLLVGRSVTGVAARGATLIATTTSFFGTFLPGGVVRSTDGGRTWAPVTGIPAGVDVFDLAADPATPARLYAATAAAVYRTDDTGATWRDISSTDPTISFLLADLGLSLAELDVGAGGRVFLIVTRFGNGAYIGYHDGGQTWTAMDLPFTPESGFSPIDVAIADPFGVFVVSPGHDLPNGALVEVDGFQGMTGVTGVFIAVVVDADSFFLFEAQGVGVYTGGGRWRLVNGTNPRSKSRSNDAPIPFGPVRRPGGQGAIHLSIAADPRDRNIVYVGGDRQDLNFGAEVLNFLGAENFSGRLFRGDTRIAPTGGVPSPQWAHLTHRNDIAEIPGGGTASRSSPHADSRDLEFDAAGELIEADDGGIYRRTSPRDNTGDWIAMAGNLQITELHDIAYDRVSDTVIGGAQDTGTPMSTPGSLLWFDYTQGDGGDVAVDDTTLASEGLSIRYTGFPNRPIAVRSTWDANGDLVDEVVPRLTPLDGIRMLGSFTTPLELNTLDPRRLVIGGANGTFESLDQGGTTRRVGPAIASFTNAMAYGGTRNGEPNLDILYYGTDDIVLRRAAAGAAATPTVTPFPGTQVRDIALAPQDHDVAFVLDPGRVFLTPDGGATWHDLTGNLVDASLRSVVVIPIAARLRLIVVGGLTGVSVALHADGQTAAPPWFRLGSNLPSAPVWDLDWDSSARLLTVATLGRGAFQARL